MTKAKRVGIILLAIVLVLGAVSFAFDRWMLGQTYERFPGRTASILPTYEDYDAAAYPRTDVAFQLNEYTLRGHVYGPQNTRGLIVLRHGIFSQHQDYLCFITAFVDKGWRVFAYDAIGCGESDGDSTLGMSQSPIDVAAAVDFARESGMANGLKIALVGHSWGGYGVATALGRTEDIAACVTMSGFDTRSSTTAPKMPWGRLPLRKHPCSGWPRHLISEQMPMFRLHRPFAIQGCRRSSFMAWAIIPCHTKM